MSATLAGVLADKDIDSKQKEVFAGEDKERAYQFRKLSEEQTEIGQMIRTAKNWKVQSGIQAYMHVESSSLRVI
ncbi:MAG: hypothetical protein IPP49_21395 [Saprospiraceae bacterium]|nr:hypothetical protein [Saprospiraceae bacterium]